MVGELLQRDHSFGSRGFDHFAQVVSKRVGLGAEPLARYSRRSGRPGRPSGDCLTGCRAPLAAANAALVRALIASRSRLGDHRHDADYRLIHVRKVSGDEAYACVPEAQ